MIAAADPAQPYGAALPWPKPAGGRAARVAGAQVVLLGGEPALFVERGGRSIVSLREPDEEWLRPALAALVEHVKDRRGKRLAVERFDGEPVGETELMPLLLEAGFLAGPAPSCPAPVSRPEPNRHESGAVPSPIPGYAHRGWRVDFFPTREGSFGEELPVGDARRG